MNPDHTLQIHYVTAQDAGWYTCKAANDVGVATASAQLLVEGKVMSRNKRPINSRLAFRLCSEQESSGSANDVGESNGEKFAGPPQKCYTVSSTICLFIPDNI